MYVQDSFYDLPMWGRLGVAGISAALFLLFLWLGLRLFRGRPLWIALPAAMALYWVFVWVSPQVYYQFYHTLFPDLPVQWVIWPPPAPSRALELLLFQGPQSLSAHGKGLLGWALLATPLARLFLLRRGENR